MSALVSIAVVAVLASCGGGVSSDSNTPSNQHSTTSTEYSSPSPPAEDSSNAADIVGNLILLSDNTDNNMLDDIGTSCMLTFVDTDTGQTSSRTFTLPEGVAINPGGKASIMFKRCGSWRLPFNANLTRIAVVGDPSPPQEPDGANDRVQYYRSAGYVEANGQYVEVTTAESSFGGEGGYYAATFQDDQLLVLTKDSEWVDPVSQEVKVPGPGGFADLNIISLYISGSGPADYGHGGCSVPSRITRGCYGTDSVNDPAILLKYTVAEDYEGSSYYDSRTGGYSTSETIVEIEDGECDLLLAVDSKDNFYCAAETPNWQQQLVRIDRSTGEALAITPKTDQDILQVIVSSNDEQVLFTARREGDPITAYAVAAAGGTEPRELSALTGELSEEDQLYSWTATQYQDQESTPEEASAPGTREDTEVASNNENKNLASEFTAEEIDASPELSPAQVLALQYQYINAGDYEAAYELFAEESQEIVSLDQYRAFFEDVGYYQLTDYSFPSVDVQGDSAVVEVNLTSDTPTGEGQYQRVQQMVLEDGEWRIVMRDEQIDIFTKTG